MIIENTFILFKVEKRWNIDYLIEKMLILANTSLLDGKKLFDWNQMKVMQGQINQLADKKYKVIIIEWRENRCILKKKEKIYMIIVR